MEIDKDIIKRYIKGECTDAENQLLEDWIEYYQVDADASISKSRLIKHLNSLDHRVLSKKSSNILSFSRLSWAAAVLCVLMPVGYYLVNEVLDSSNDLALSDIKAPDSSNAVIVLDNDIEFDLDELPIGDTIMADGYLITKSSLGELNYIVLDSSKSSIQNVIRTKNGGLARVKLSDGSTVWLNANSMLKYPIKFDDDARIVELSGEGYFDIVHAKDYSGRPFYVHSDNLSIKVFGTKFNADLKNNTVALLEGSVGIQNKELELDEIQEASFSVKLYPNQYYSKGDVKYAANIERYIDWQLGFFDLDEIDLLELGVKFESWYGIKVEVDPRLRHQKLFGRMSRQNDLEDLLETIARVAPFEYVFENNILKITPKKNK